MARSEGLGGQCRGAREAGQGILGEAGDQACVQALRPDLRGTQLCTVVTGEEGCLPGSMKGLRSCRRPKPGCPPFVAPGLGDGQLGRRQCGGGGPLLDQGQPGTYSCCVLIWEGFLAEEASSEDNDCSAAGGPRGPLWSWMVRTLCQPSPTQGTWRRGWGVSGGVGLRQNSRSQSHSADRWAGAVSLALFAVWRVFLKETRRCLLWAGLGGS